MKRVEQSHKDFSDILWYTKKLHTGDCGQASINISKPRITNGQHWHNSKWELFIVVAGHGLIQERNINTGEMVKFEVSGEKIEAERYWDGSSVLNQFSQYVKK